MPRPGACSSPASRRFSSWVSMRRRHGIGIKFRMPKLDEPTRRFLKALGPAIIGAGGVQLALFADTLIASFLPSGALSALYYADRINQLPIGVVGIAVGTVLLPEMSRRLATGEQRRRLGAGPRRPARAPAHGALRGRVARHPRSHHARALRARRIHRRRCGRRRRHARRLRRRSPAFRPSAQLHRALLCTRRHRHAREGRAARRRHQHRAESGAHGPSGPSRACACDLGRRLDQFVPAGVVRAPPGFRRLRGGHRQAGAEASGRGRRSRGRARRGLLRSARRADASRLPRRGHVSAPGAALAPSSTGSGFSCFSDVAG